MDKDFLKKLEDAVNKGDFNSEVAKKINKVTILADEKKIPQTDELVEKRLADFNIQMLDDKDPKFIDEYDRATKANRLEDRILNILAHLYDIEMKFKNDLQEHLLEIEKFIKEIDNLK